MVSSSLFSAATFKKGERDRKEEKTKQTGFNTEKQLHLSAFSAFLFFLMLYILFFLKILFIYFYRQEGREKERERKISVWLPLPHPLLGTWSATQACVLTGNRSNNPSVHRPVLNPLSHTSQGSISLKKNKNKNKTIRAEKTQTLVSVR